MWPRVHGCVCAIASGDENLERSPSYETRTCLLPLSHKVTSPAETSAHGHGAINNNNKHAWRYLRPPRHGVDRRVDGVPRIAIDVHVPLWIVMPSSGRLRAHAIRMRISIVRWRLSLPSASNTAASSICSSSSVGADAYRCRPLCQITSLLAADLPNRRVHLGAHLGQLLVEVDVGIVQTRIILVVWVARVEVGHGLGVHALAGPGAVGRLRGAADGAVARGRSSTAAQATTAIRAATVGANLALAPSRVIVRQGRAGCGGRGWGRCGTAVEAVGGSAARGAIDDAI
jgi:hypothetical protein